MGGMSAYLCPVKELAVIALSGRSNARDGFHVSNSENVLPYWIFICRSNPKGLHIKRLK